MTQKDFKTTLAILMLILILIWFGMCGTPGVLTSGEVESKMIEVKLIE